MWLLGSTTEGDKKGLADYFSQPLKVSMMGGKGSGETSSVIQGGGKDLRSQVGQVATAPALTVPTRLRRKRHSMLLRPRLPNKRPRSSTA